MSPECVGALVYAARFLFSIITSMVKSCEGDYNHGFDDEDSHGPDCPNHNLHEFVQGFHMMMIVLWIMSLKIFSGTAVSACVRLSLNSFQRKKG